MWLQRISEHVGEPVKAVIYSALAFFASKSIELDWILTGRDVMSFISMCALALLNVLILCSYIHRKWFKK